MHVGEAFAQLGKLPSAAVRTILADESAEAILRAAAALIIARRPDLPLDERVGLLVDTWSSAQFELRRHVLKALSYCNSPRSLLFLNKQLSVPDLHFTALNGLAMLGDEGILPACQDSIRFGTESECRSALSILINLRNPAAISIIETALSSSPFESCREWAAFLLANHRIPTGERVLERRLFSLSPVKSKNDEYMNEVLLNIDPDYLLTAIALAQINNEHGLLALENLIVILINDQRIGRRYCIDMTIGLIRASPAINFQEWGSAMQQWINNRRGHLLMD